MMKSKAYQPEIPVKASETSNKYNRIDDIPEEKPKTVKGECFSGLISKWIYVVKTQKLIYNLKYA